MECCKTQCEAEAEFVLHTGGGRYPACAAHLTEAMGIVRAAAPPGALVQIEVLHGKRRR